SLRRCGIGGALIATVEAWAAASGYDELASDTQLDNADSLAAHLALGFEEVERAIHFRKRIEISHCAPMPDPLHPGRTSADKPIRCSVAAVVTDGSAILAVQRPPDDDRLPNVWGLPAVTLRPGELPESGLRRVGSEKLSVPLVPVELLGVGSIDR